MQNNQAAHSCNKETQWGAPPAAAPRPFAHSAEDQEAKWSPVTVCTEVADSSTAAVAGAEKGLAVDPTAPDGTSEEHC